MAYNKYHARKATVMGETFDSRREAERWMVLKASERVGTIQNLRRQVKYELIPAQRINGKVVERSVSYIADFVYERDGETVVEDAKGKILPVYIIKRKLMLWVYGIQVKEV